MSHRDHARALKNAKSARESSFDANFSRSGAVSTRGRAKPFAALICRLYAADVQYVAIRFANDVATIDSRSVAPD
ncbi:hypothetical protein A1355_15430 [Methylomonas koyamae]|uniref:Uncharacterized protein n=1 Tax=Methylomonas koyamae TaxID=702114 RepID=A0A177N179_9GAMM|nr:hypothetical protein A1355_15430 [Methylomonas koyamae]